MVRAWGRVRADCDARRWPSGPWDGGARVRARGSDRDEARGSIREGARVAARDRVRAKVRFRVRVWSRACGP